MTSFPGEISQLPNDRLITLHHTHHERGSTLFLFKYTITLNINFPSMSMSLLPKIIHGLTECFIHYHLISHAVASDYETFFTEN